jgi:hypothetical protein
MNITGANILSFSSLYARQVPLMDMKLCTEKYLAQIGVPFTVFRLCGFMQVCSIQPAYLSPPYGRTISLLKPSSYINVLYCV